MPTENLLPTSSSCGPTIWVLHGSRTVDLVVPVRIGNQGEDIGDRCVHDGAADDPPVVGVDHGHVAHVGIL